ncbi:sporulation-specific diadenylate cyclase CdaS [Kroppenstedtia eburnea]|uniref:sporulation-specific diadenylate cyclase CdaS n=1 Tax=Kroppenstedtia eburnea TaxID=714067 RepID=UPI00363093E9
MNEDLLQPQCDFSPMKSAVKANLMELSEEIHRIVDALDHEEEEYCLLREITNMRETFAQIESLAASFYLECYLAPYTNKYLDLSNSVQNLSRKQHGALMVVRRETPLELWVQPGVPVGAELSGSLLESIFYPGSPLHDGAVVIEGSTIVSASNVLPLSNRQTEGRKLGTRHRAALGLSERTDALIIVVSEETGRASFAFKGNLYPLNVAEVS